MKTPNESSDFLFYTSAKTLYYLHFLINNIIITVIGILLLIRKENIRDE